jgi:hypothetical protein
VISFLVDQNFNEHIVDGLTRRIPSLDMVLVRQVGLAEARDPALLEWAAAQERVLLTHDRSTMPAFAFARVEADQPMSGVFLVSDSMPVGQAIEEIALAAQCLSPDECANRVSYFPL